MNTEQRWPDCAIEATTTLNSATEWGSPELVTYGQVAAVRESLDLRSYGCGALGRDLLCDGLLDEPHLNMTSVGAGRGRRLFDEPSGLLAFDLVDSRTYPNGAIRPLCRLQDG